MPSRQRILSFFATGPLLLLAGCVNLDTGGKPIHIILDINIRIERELEDFFNDLDAANPIFETSTESGEQP